MTKSKSSGATIDALTQLAGSEGREEIERASKRVREVLGETLPHYEALLAQLSSRAEELERLRTLAGSDELTGLANRRSFLESLERHIAGLQRRNVCHSVLLMDLDDLKPLNDLHGHQAGDEALRQVSSACLANVRASDLVARLGGDEFAVLLGHTSASGARRAAVRYRETIESRQVLGVPLKVSIGTATVDRAGTDAASLLGQADASLYEDKRARKQRRISEPPMAA